MRKASMGQFRARLEPSTEPPRWPQTFQCRAPGHRGTGAKSRVAVHELDGSLICMSCSERKVSGAS